MTISTKGMKLLAFVMAVAIVLSGLVYSPKAAKAADPEVEVSVRGATLEFGRDDEKQSMKIAITVQNASKAKSCSIDLTVGEKKITIATDGEESDIRKIHNKMYSINLEEDYVVYAVNLNNIPSGNFSTDIGIQGHAETIATDEVESSVVSSDSASRSVNGIVKTMQDRYPGLNITLKETGMLSKDNGEYDLTADDIENYVDPTATPDPTAAPTAAPTAIPTATPNPTRPPMEEPAEPYTLEFSEQTIKVQGNATYNINDDNSVTIGVNAQYSGIAFVVPESQNGKNYDTVTVTYSNSENIGSGYGCGLKGVGVSAERAEETVEWGGIFTNTNGGTYTGTIVGKEGNKIWRVDEVLFFFNDTNALNNGPANVTITSVTFSHSQYKAPEPTVEPTRDPATNLATNGDFSNGKTGWSTNYNDNDLTVSENNYGVVAGRWNSYSGAQYVIDRGFAADDVIEFAFDVKLRNNYKENNRPRFTCKFTLSDGSSSSALICLDAENNDVCGNVETWTRVQGSYTVPAHTNSLTILILEDDGYYAYNNESNIIDATFYIDNLHISTKNEEPPTPTPAPTEAPATEAPATPEPTEVPAPATPEPSEAPATPEPSEAPATPEPNPSEVVLDIATAITDDGNAIVTPNADGTVTASVTAQYGGFWINIPAELQAQFEKVEITYTDGAGGFGYACRYSETSGDQSIEWGGNLDGSGATTKNVTGGTLTRFKFFNTASSLSAETPATVTITEVKLTKNTFIEVPAEAEVFSKTVDLTDADAYSYDGGVSAVYNEETSALDVTYGGNTAVIFWAPEEEGVTYTQVKVTLANANTITFYLLDADVTDGIGQTPAGQHATGITSPTGTEEQTAYTLKGSNSFKDTVKAVKLVRQSDNGTTASVTAVEFIGYKEVTE